MPSLKSVEAAAKWSDRTVANELKSAFDREDTNTAGLLLRLGEFDARKLYAPAGYASMYAYCVEALHRSGDSINKRIRAARLARQFPAVLSEIATGRLCLTAILQLGAYLTSENVDELLAAAAHRTGPEIAQLLAERFPRPDVATRLDPVVPASDQLAAQPLVGTMCLESASSCAAASAAPSRIAPLSAERLEVQFTIDGATHETLRYVQRLLGHDNPAHDLPSVIDRALRVLARELEKRKFAATSAPRASATHDSRNPRYIPAHVKRAVWQRDGGQCTFRSDDGHRCTARAHLDYDHIKLFAWGGRSTVANLRLRCRAHNQYDAERALGVAFMRRKREEARAPAVSMGGAGARATEQGERSATRRPVAAHVQREQQGGGVATPASDESNADRAVTPWLRRLGVRADDIRRAAAHCDAMHDAPLEARVREALAFLGGPRSSASA